MSDAQDDQILCILILLLRHSACMNEILFVEQLMTCCAQCKIISIVLPGAYQILVTNHQSVLLAMHNCSPK